MTYVDIDGRTAETNFTVVAAEYRGLGVGTAVKALSVHTLIAEGVETLRTGGAAENVAILTANRRLGYAVDEEWVTLERRVEAT